MRDRSAELKVKDTGYGIPQDVMPHIFEPFFTTKAETNGSGLGLAIAHGIVAQHGGEILVDSQVQKGTEFTIVLPVRQAGSPSNGGKGGGEAEASGAGERPAIVSDVANAKEISQ